MEIDSCCPLSAFSALRPWDQTNLRGDVVPRQPSRPREKERVVLCGFNSETGEGQQKKNCLETERN